jgi:ADP-heptose:LPS heptosyltransferase
MRTAFVRLRWLATQWLNRQRGNHLVNVLVAPPVQLEPALAGQPVLFVVEGGIGDVVLSLPVITAFQQEYQPGPVTLAVSSRAREIAGVLAGTTDLVTTDGSDDRDALRRHLATDWVIGLRARPATTWLIRRARARIAGWRDWRPALGAQHERTLMALTAGVRKPLTAMVCVANPSLRHDLALLKPGGRDLRQWPLTRWAEVARKLHQGGFTVYTVGSLAEREDCMAVLRMAGLPDSLNQAGTTSGPELVDLIKRATVVVGSDSGVMHLAAFHGRPTVTLFGPVRPSQFAPGIPDAPYVIYHPRRCSPCQQTLCCFPPGSRCMDDITVDEVVAAVTKAVTWPISQSPEATAP